MAKKQGDTVGAKSGATKKATAAPKLTSIEGGKGKKATAAATNKPHVAVLLRDNKTRANGDAMRRALKVYGVSFAEDASDKELLALVRAHLGKVLKNTPEEDKIKCTNVCTEVSTADTDHCPFCGDEGADEDQPIGDDLGDPPEVPVEVVVDEVEADAPGAAEAGEVQTGDAIAVATARLDAAVEKINGYRRNLAVCSYDMGIELKLIHVDELWKARGYDSFNEFCAKGLDISRGMAYRLIEVVTQFDRETFETVGSKKLALIAGIADNEARDAALEAAKSGATTKEVERHVGEAKGKPTAPPKEKSSSSGGGTPGPVKRASNEITLLTKIGSKPQLVGFRSASTGRAIAHHKDDAYAELQIAEDVKLRMAPKLDKDGNLVGMTVLFVRNESE